jgi:hypothetical protein
VALALAIEVLEEEQAAASRLDREIQQRELSSSTPLVCEIEQKCHLAIICGLFARIQLAVVMETIAGLDCAIIYSFVEKHLCRFRKPMLHCRVIKWDIRLFHKLLQESLLDSIEQRAHSSVECKSIATGHPRSELVTHGQKALVASSPFLNVVSFSKRSNGAAVMFVTRCEAYRDVALAKIVVLAVGLKIPSHDPLQSTAKERHQGIASRFLEETIRSCNYRERRIKGGMMMPLQRGTRHDHEQER